MNSIFIGLLIGVIIAEIILKENEHFYNVEKQCKEVPSKVTLGIKNVMTGVTKPVGNALKKVGSDMTKEFSNIKDEIADLTLGNIKRELNNAYTLISLAIGKIFNQLPILKFFIYFMPILVVLIILSPFLVILSIMGLLFGWPGILIAFGVTCGFMFWLYMSAMAVKSRIVLIISKLYKILPFDKLLSVFEPLKKIPEKLSEIFNKINIIPDLKLAENIGKVFKAIFDAICAAVGAVEKLIKETKKGISTSINTAFVKPINGIVNTVNKIPGVSAKKLKDISL